MTIIRVLLAIMAIYLELALPLSSSVFVPHFAAFVLALTVLPRFRYQRWVLVSGLAAVGFCIFNVLTTSFGRVPMAERLKSSVYFLFLFGIAVMLVAAPFVQGKERRTASFVFLGVGFALLLFAALEQGTPLSRVSDAFRYHAYERSQYDDDNRDRVLLGKVRPKAFTREPSFAARGISILLIFGGMLSRSAGVRLAALAGIGALVAVTGSPTALPFGLCLLYGLPVPRGLVRGGMIIPYHLVLTILAAGMVLVAVQTVPVLQQRFDLFRSGEDRSSWRRTDFMQEVAIKALQFNLVSGVGMGGEDELASELVLSGTEADPTSSLLNNAMWSIPMFMGLTGTALFIALLCGLAWRVPPQFRMVFLMTILATLNFTGTISSTAAWFVGAMLYSILTQPDVAQSRKSWQEILPSPESIRQHGEELGEELPAAAGVARP